MTGVDLGCHQWRQTAFVAGLGLSVFAAIVLLLAMYFANTAPQLPSTAAALETLTVGSGWPSPIKARALNRQAAPMTAQASIGSLTLLPRAPDASEAPPIDLSDLPPPDRPIR